MILKRNMWINYLFVYLCLYAYHLIVSKSPGDDLTFAKAAQHYNVVQWLSKRYFDWSGRLFPDAMSLLLLANKVWLWRLINPLVIIVLAYGLVRIWKKNVRMVEFLTALCIIGYFTNNILSSGFFWITGSMYYLWAIALGLLAMIPYADQGFREEKFKNNFQFILCLIFGFLASVANEQASLCMSCFAILSHIVLFRQKKPQDKRLFFLTIIITIGTLILLLAPGSHVRSIKEATYWYPGFEHLTLKDHFYIGTIWGFEKLFIDMKNLLFLLSILAVIPYFKDEQLRNNLIFKVFSLVLCMMVLFHLTGLGLEHFYKFEAIRNFNFTATLFSISLFKRTFISAVFPYLFWSVYSLMLLYLLLKNTKRKIFVLFCILAVISTLVLMFFSPTIYGSGNRVLTVGAVLLAIIMIGRMIEQRMIGTFFYLSIFAIFPIINLSDMFFIWLTKGFNPFL
ncbi:DUF6056 family protein [Neobacillus pocheonensis]|uniref:DUF6056 family protein n=1 Tax=Neobacillus pocheonensis TaxID=363869 RepID=A0ABT0WBQ3_9BACI|nr:DUF6056 family protein [Neobacillus pocheonensis]